MFNVARIISSLFVASLLRAAAAESAPVDFSRDIQPIFEQHCYECHGPKKQKSGFRLDRKADALRGGDSGKSAILAGTVAESLLFAKITATNKDDLMPPEGKGERLTDAQTSLIRRWIESGASWPEDGSGGQKKHWAYVKPTLPQLPPTPANTAVRNPIDNFVLARLAKENLQPAAEAQRAILVRRLSLDLTGLPPTLDELKRFASDNSERSWEAAVDYYLNSPHYGEQRARLWLDLARYADSHGYEKDPGREMWLYRDWAINAFNDNMPFDRFTIEQIAGDLLPNATKAQKIASGFHRNTMFNTEGGVDKEQARVETIVDRVNTTATVWLGSTLGCAQCHTHKYDPFTQKEYYQVYAFLNNADEPEMDVPSPEQAQERETLKAAIEPLEKTMNTDTPELKKAQAVWEYGMADDTPKWSVLEPIGAISAGGATLSKQEDNSILPEGLNPINDTYTVVVHSDSKRLTGLRLQVLPDEHMPHKSLGRANNGSFVLSRFEVKAAPKNNPKAAKTVTFKTAAADFTQSGHSAMNLIDGKDGKGWAVSAGEEKMRVERYVLFEAEEPLEFNNGVTLTITLKHESQTGDANLGRFRLSATESEKVIPPYIPPASILNVLAIAPLDRTKEHREKLAAYYRSIAPELKDTRELLAAKKKDLDQLQKRIPKALVLEERKKEPRETHIQIRGNFLNPGDKVSPAVPAVLNPLEGEPNRVNFARWLVSPENPLTARVLVNRFWSQFFGRGIVETEEDFGTQGAPPTHPELLDWLAVNFMESGWDVKALHKMVAMSATYRQDSKITPELQEKDPANRFYARGPRFRLPAENIRDVVLTSSGLLEPGIGGPSVYPYQPDGIWTQIYGDEKWQTSTNANRYRRGLYTYWKRTSPYPAFMTFDAPSREYCTARRPRTNTPLQALTTLNDPAYIEAAQTLAQRILAAEGDFPQRLEMAYRRCVARAPRQNEVDRLRALYKEELSKYAKDRDAAKAMAFGKHDAPPECPLAEAAAWTVLANVILNLDETVTKG